MNDYALLEKTAKLWGEVQEENARDKAYVTSQEWETWEKVNKQVVDQLNQVIDSLQGNALAEEKIEVLEKINTMVQNSQRLDQKELELRLKGPDHLRSLFKQ